MATLKLSAPSQTKRSDPSDEQREGHESGTARHDVDHAGDNAAREEETKIGEVQKK